MKKEITPLFASKVLKLNKNYKAEFSIQYLNIEVINLETDEVYFISIHEFVHTHCRDFLLSYANGLKIKSETKCSSEEDRRILSLHFSISLTVPNLLDGENVVHVETFSGVSELMLFTSAVEWLIKYRKDNLKLSKFWINKF